MVTKCLDMTACLMACQALRARATTVASVQHIILLAPVLTKAFVSAISSSPRTAQNHLFVRKILLQGSMNVWNQEHLLPLEANAEMIRNALQVPATPDSVPKAQAVFAHAIRWMTLVVQMEKPASYHLP